MTDRTPLTVLEDVRPDPLADLAAGVPEHLEMFGEAAKVIAGEYAALVAEGMSPIAAAIVTGQRWRMTT